MALERGELIVKQGKKNQPPRIQVRVGKTDFNPAQGEVSQSLLDRLQEFSGKEVEFERVGGQPRQIREVGVAFVPPRRQGPESRPRDARGPGGRAPGSRRPEQQREQEDRTEPQQPPDFHNPYNFVPAPPRNTSHGDLGDHRPVDQDTFLQDRYSGSIRVHMTVETPLLVPDAENVRKSSTGHKTYSLLVGPDGKPLIPASSVRGMLRFAYEAVTNSRFGRLSREQHGDRLAFRMETQEGLRLIPARIENGHIRLLTGNSSVGPDSKPNGPMYAGWLPRYDRGRINARSTRYPDSQLPEHGDAVECWLELFQHHRWNSRTNRHVPDFQYWSVREIARGAKPLGVEPQRSGASGQNQGHSWHEPLGNMKKIRGWVCVTNANINRKHDERIFWGDTKAPGPFPLNDAHRSQWRELIQNYQSIHKDDLDRRCRSGKKPDEYLGAKPGQTAWSRHVYAPDDLELGEGTLCYVRLNERQTEIDALFPVMIARELYPASPWDLLDESLKPPATIEQLSPADRVFGWVKSDSQGDGQNSTAGSVAVRGLLRVGPVVCESSVDDAIQSFPGDGVPLAILSAPKPQQGRFYVARSPNGEAQQNGLNKAGAGYTKGKGLRGRKIYPHHAGLPDGHWDDPMQDRTQVVQGSPAHYQEYRRPRKNDSEQRDDQNRSMLGWVKPRAQFTFNIQVHNLSEVELGALLWLLKLPEERFFRFGGGKPLGFGSVRLVIDNCDVRTGRQGLLARYKKWCTTTEPADPSDVAIESFKKALCEAYPPPEGGGFEDIPFIAAFLTVCRGFSDSLPVHYPRATGTGQPSPPSPDGESFKWFVANEKGLKLALPNLAEDKGLPTLKEP